MWKWIAKEKRGGRWHSSATLKKEWLNNNGFKNIYIACTCFFCQYAATRSKDDSTCPYCPGRKIDPDFDCMTEPNYAKNPIDFYKLLLALNRKRKKK
jgi:hypothetical protein